MADYHLKGSTDSWEQSLRTDNGCTARQPGCARGPVDGAVAGHASEWDPRVVARRALAVYAAYRIGRERAPAAIVRATGLDDLPKLSKAVLSGMLQMALVVAATTAIGGIAGGAIGALFAGVGAAPGAAVGAEIGFNAGMAVLTWMGLAAIAIEIVRGIGEVTNLLQRGVVTAWEAEDAPNREAEIDAAGELLAEAIGKLMLLVLLAIVARLTASQALASSERTAAASSEVFAMLRRSRLGAEFAAWVEANAERLMRNPKLKAHREATGSSARTGDAATPSQVKQSGSGPRAREPESPVPTSVDFGTKPNEAIFWSGKTQGIGGADMAAAIGGSQRTTLEALIKARGIDLPPWDANNPAVVQAWKEASRAFANGASGEVKAVIGQTMRPGNVWETVELPALKSNPAVTKIIQIDPLSRVETVIFQR